MNFKFYITIFLLAVIVSFFYVLGASLTCATTATAVDFGIITGVAGPTGATNTIEYNINAVFNIIIAVAQVSFIILFLVGGVMYLTAGVSENQAEKARKLILEAVVGIVIVFAAWGAGTWFLNALK